MEHSGVVERAACRERPVDLRVYDNLRQMRGLSLLRQKNSQGSAYLFCLNFRARELSIIPRAVIESSLGSLRRWGSSAALAARLRSMARR